MNINKKLMPTQRYIGAPKDSCYFQGTNRSICEAQEAKMWGNWQKMKAYNSK